MTRMKRIFATALSLLLVLCLLTGGVSAARFDWEDGVLPSGWYHSTYITARDILAPVNPNASQESKNLLAYLSAVSDSSQLISGQFDISNSEEAYDAMKAEFGVEPGVYSARYVVDEGEGALGKKGKDPSVWDDSVLAFQNVDCP